MSLLEDRILRIMELRQAGKSHAAIARSLHLPTKSIMQYESSLRASMEEVLQEGVGTVGELAAKLEMTRTVTGMAMVYFGLEIPKELPIASKTRSNLPKTERLAQIQSLAAEGKTKREIAQELALSYGYVSQLARQEGIAITMAYRGRVARVLSQSPRARLNPSEQASRVQTALEQGERSLEVLLQQAQCGAGKFQDICKEYQITLPEDIIPYRWRPEFDTLIERGQTLGEIAAATGKKRQQVEQYINQSGQHHFWRQQRAAQKQLDRQQSEDEKSLQRNFLYLLEQRIDELAIGNFSLQKAVEYGCLRRKSERNIPFQKLVAFFQRYETARQQGKKRSLQQLSRGIFGPPTAGYLLRCVELPPLHGNYDVSSREVTRQKKEHIRRDIFTLLTATDLEYFTGIPVHSIRRYIKQEGGRGQKGSTAGIKRFGFRKSDILTYRLASEIYEAHDADFTPQETTLLLEIQQQVVDYALEHKKEISDTIINALHTMYPEKSIERPYLLRGELPVFRDVKQEAMQRAFERLPWNVTVVSYFLDVSFYHVQNYYRKQGGKPTPKFLKMVGAGTRLTIPTASKVYELQDQGLEEKEIQQRLHQPQQVIGYAVQHRSAIEPEIIAGLRVLFPDEKVTKPYK